MTGPAHGTTTGYHYYGCRCGRCRAAVAADVKAARARRKSLPAKQIPHGTRNGYVNYGCTCGPCRAAHAAYVREHRQRRATAPPT